MATLNVNGAVNTVTSQAFIRTVAMVMVGSLTAQVATQYARDNVYDVQVRGGDAVYALAGAVVTLAIAPRKFGRPAAVGMVASGGITAAREYNLI